MASINIGGENAGDAFYRYKMPKLKARVSECVWDVGRGVAGHGGVPSQRMRWARRTAH